MGLAQQMTSFFCIGHSQTLIAERWDKYLNKLGGYVEK